jgi:hypothetical protein
MSFPKSDNLMNRPLGNILRMTGLLIEMVGVWAIFSGQGDRNATLISLPGGNQAPVVWVVVVGVGFLLWLTGRILVSLKRPQRPLPERIDEKLAWPPQIDDDVPPQPDRIDAERGS